MAFSENLDNENDVVSEINMTPLVDVMLVLLIIFIITIPVINHAVKIDLPKAQSQPSPAKPEQINLAIDAQGNIFWNTLLIDEQNLKSKLIASAQQTPQPELHLNADRKTVYERIAKLMALVQSSGITKLGFVTDPQLVSN